MKNRYETLFDEVYIGNCRIKNRFVMAAMGPMGLADAEGAFTQRGVEYYVARAAGGTGLITTGVCYVNETVEKHMLPSSPSVVNNPIQFIRTSREMNERIHAHDAKIFLQLTGGFGRVLPGVLMDKQKPVAPSPIQHRMLDVTCRELTVEEIHEMIESFGKGAAVAKTAGYDGIQIHAVHEGYLIDQFAISFFNQRQDEYGGSLENRLRFAKEIREEIAKTCGRDFPVSVRFSPKSFIKDWREGGLPGETFVEKGRDVAEGIETAKLLEEYGYDALDVDVGCYDAWWWNHPPMYQEKGLYRSYAKLVKDAVTIPVICAGRMDDPDMALDAVQDGTTDMIGLARPLLADPDYVNKLRTGRQDEIRPCLSCHEGCMGRLQKYSLLNCAVNPQACRERDMAYRPVLKSKKVIVVGGGPAGCEAARVLAIRGHRPELYERGSRLGGNLIPGGAPDFKEDDRALADWYTNILQKLQVPVHLDTEVTAEKILQSDADEVIIATGSTPKLFSLGDDTNVFAAADVLTGKKKPGGRIAVIGGGLVGCETALWLAESGKEVTIVEVLDKIMKVNGPSCTANLNMLRRLLPFNGVSILTGVRADRFEHGILRLSDGNEVICDSVIIAAGYNASRSLYDELKHQVENIHLLGDARQVANIMYAIWDAFEVANCI